MACSPNERLAELAGLLPGMTDEELARRRRLEETRLALHATFDTRPLAGVKAEQSRRPAT